MNFYGRFLQDHFQEIKALMNTKDKRQESPERCVKYRRFTKELGRKNFMTYQGLFAGNSTFNFCLKVFNL